MHKEEVTNKPTCYNNQFDTDELFSDMNKTKNNFKKIQDEYKKIVEEIYSQFKGK